MGEDDAKHRGRMKGATLLRALMKTFRWRIAVGAIMLMGDSAAHIAQVGVGGAFVLLFWRWILRTTSLCCHV